MPQGDGTGPQGMGPMTGRRGGFCAGYRAPRVANIGRRRGAGMRGGGYGWRNQFAATGLFGWQRADTPPPTASQQAEALKTQAQALERELDALNQQINALEQK